MKCQNCQTELPEEALFCNVCGADVLRENPEPSVIAQANDAQTNYAAPEGFELDPGGSGQYYRYDTVTNPNTGESAQWVTWFDPIAGAYQQINCSEQEQTGQTAPEPSVIATGAYPVPRHGEPQSPEPSATVQPVYVSQPSTPPGPVSAKLDGYAKSSALPPAVQTPQKSGIPRAVVIAVPLVALLVSIGASFLYSGGMALFQRDEPYLAVASGAANAAPAPSETQSGGDGIETESGSQADQPAEPPETMSGGTDEPGNDEPPAPYEDEASDEYDSGDTVYVDGIEITLEWDSGDRTGIYAGAMRNGLPNGHGTFISRNSEGMQWVYSGDWVDGNMHGRGVVEWENGALYEGDINNNRRHGKGTFKFLDGSTYEGDWQDDVRHGFGIVTEADGTVYSGQWQNDEYIG